MQIYKFSFKGFLVPELRGDVERRNTTTRKNKYIIATTYASKGTFLSNIFPTLVQALQLSLVGSSSTSSAHASACNDTTDAEDVFVTPSTSFSNKTVRKINVFAGGFCLSIVTSADNRFHGFSR